MNTARLWPALDAVGYDAFWYFLNVLWQSTLLFATTCAVTWFLRKYPARIRQGIWTAALVATPFLPYVASQFSAANVPAVPVTVMPAYTAPMPTHEEETSMAVSQGTEVPQLEAEKPAPTAPRAPIHPMDYPWALGLIVYAAGVLGVGSRYLGGHWRIHQWRRASVACTDPRVLEAFDTARSKLDVPSPVSIRGSSHVAVPIVCGLFRHTVLLPSACITQLSHDEWRAVSLHETVHVKQRDPLSFAVVGFIRALLFPHPLYWLAARHMANLTEQAADEAVVKCGVPPLPYARLLTRLASSIPMHPQAPEFVAGMALSKGSFTKRIEAILEARDRQVTRWMLAGTTLLCLISMSAALAFPLSPNEPTRIVPYSANPASLLKASTSSAGVAVQTGEHRPKPSHASPGQHALVQVASDAASQKGSEWVVPSLPSDPKDIPNHSLELAPAREVELISGTNSNWLDLDTGKLYPSGPKNEESNDLHAYLEGFRRIQVDLALNRPDNHRGVDFIDMLTMRVRNEAWDHVTVHELTANALLAFCENRLNLGGCGPSQPGGEVDLPATYLYRTREGGIGLLQVLELERYPSRARLRYRSLINPGDPEGELPPNPFTLTREEAIRKWFAAYTDDSAMRQADPTKQFWTSGPSLLRMQPMLHWEDIPVLLDLGRSGRVIQGGRSTGIASTHLSSCIEGMVALWFIEGLRRGVLYPERHRTSAGDFSEGTLPVYPVCLEPGQSVYEVAASPEIHARVYEAYRRWWDTVKSMPREQAAKLDPLKDTKLIW